MTHRPGISRRLQDGCVVFPAWPGYTRWTLLITVSRWGELTWLGDNQLISTTLEIYSVFLLWWEVVETRQSVGWCHRPVQHCWSPPERDRTGASSKLSSLLQTIAQSLKNSQRLLWSSLSRFPRRVQWNWDRETSILAHGQSSEPDTVKQRRDRQFSLVKQLNYPGVTDVGFPEYSPIYCDFDR